MEPYLLDLSTLPDHGASVLDLDDGGEPASLSVLAHGREAIVRGAAVYIAMTSPAHLLMPGTEWSAAVQHVGRTPIVLDCRRPSIQAHLCRWLAWRITGQTHACLLYRQGSLWFLSIAGDQQPIAVWSKGWRVSNHDGARNCPDLRDQDDDGEAIAALVKAHA